MLGVKQEVIKMIQFLPNEVTIDDIMAELYFKSQVDAGLKELDEGKGIPHEKVVPISLYPPIYLLYQ